MEKSNTLIIDKKRSAARKEENASLAITTQEMADGVTRGND